MSEKVSNRKIIYVSIDEDVLACAPGASHICKNTSSGSFLLPSSSFLLAPDSWLLTPIFSLAAFIEMLPVRLRTVYNKC